FRKDVVGIRDLDSLKGFPIATKADDAAADLLKQRGLDNVLSYSNYEQVVDSARQGRVNVFVMDRLPAIYFLRKLGIEGDFKQSSPVNTGGLDRAVRKGNGALLKTVEDGFSAIAPAELKRIEQKWYEKPLGSGPNLRLLAYVAASGLALIVGLALWSRALNRL